MLWAALDDRLTFLHCYKAIWSHYKASIKDEGTCCRNTWAKDVYHVIE